MPVTVARHTQFLRYAAEEFHVRTSQCTRRLDRNVRRDGGVTCPWVQGPLHAYLNVVPKQDKQVVPPKRTNVHRLATCSYCFYPLLANLCYLLLRVPGVFCIFLFVLFAASKRRHCWQSSAGRKSSFSLHCAKEVPMSSSSRPMLPHSTHTRPRLSKTKRLPWLTWAELMKLDSRLRLKRIHGVSF